MKSKKSQSIFDFAIALIAISGLIIGITRIWVWFNANYAKRQTAYQETRLSTVTGFRPSTDSSYNNPFETGYKPLDLTKEWVFKGQPSATVTGAPLNGQGQVNPRAACDSSCTASCIGTPGCGTSPEDFNSDCPCYQQCDALCVCNTQIKSAVVVFAQQIRSICGPDDNCDRCDYAECDTPEGCGQACILHKNAQSMRDAAGKCDDWWELCWWGDWGKSSNELRKAARELDKNGRYLEKNARRLGQRSQDLQNCCNNYNTIPLQAHCFEQAEVSAKCDEQCFNQSIEWQEKCEAKIGGFLGKLLGGLLTAICESRAEASYTACFRECLASGSS